MVPKQAAAQRLDLQSGVGKAVDMEQGLGEVEKNELVAVGEDAEPLE